METLIVATLVSASYIFVVTLQFGYIARRLAGRVILLEPLIALSGAIGILKIVEGPMGVAGYVLGSTIGCAAAMLMLKNGHGKR